VAHPLCTVSGSNPAGVAHQCRPPIDPYSIEERMLRLAIVRLHKLLIVIVPLLAPVPHLVDLLDDNIAKTLPNIKSVLHFLVPLLCPLGLLGSLHLLCDARALF
jgi:hypothetical protein